LAYETFERGSVRSEELSMTVAPTGRILLNAASSRTLEEAGVKAVKILWDKELHTIALQATKKGDKNAYSIARGGSSRSSTVTVKAFLHYIGWSSDRRQTVIAKWDAQQKMLEAELPARFVKVRGDKQPDPGMIPSAPDPFGGNDNNRRVAERMAKDRSITAHGTPAKLSGEGTG
jgi:hypothetical protein